MYLTLHLHPTISDELAPKDTSLGYINKEPPTMNGSVISIINKKKGQYINLLISPGKERWYTWSRWEPLWQNMQNGFIWEAVL